MGTLKPRLLRHHARLNSPGIQDDTALLAENLTLSIVLENIPPSAGSP